MRYLEYRTPYELQREQASRLLKSTQDTATTVPCQHGWHYDRSMYPSTVVQEVRRLFIPPFCFVFFSNIFVAVELGLRSQLLCHVGPGAFWPWRIDRQLCVRLPGGSVGSSSLLLCVSVAGDCRLCRKCLRLELLLLAGTALCGGSHCACHPSQSLRAGHRVGRTRATCLLHHRL